MTIKNKNIISKILNYGIKPDMEFFESTKVYLFNLFAFITIPLQLSFAVYHLFIGNYSLSFTNFLNLPIILFGYFSIKYSNLKQVRSFLIFLISTLTIYTIIIHHRENQFILISLVIAALIIYDSFWLFFIHLMLSFATIILFRIYQFNQEFISYNFILQQGNFIISLIILASILILIKYLIDKNNTESVYQLRNKEHFYKSLIENAFDGIAVIDENYNIIYRSPSGYRITGWRNDEINEMNLENIFHPDDVDLMYSFIKKAKNTPNKQIKVEYRVLHKNGNYIWLLGHITYTTIKKDQNITIINFSDVTEQKLIYDKLHESEIFHRTIIESIAEGISLFDENGNSIFKNNAALKLLDKVTTSDTLDGAHPDDQDCLKKSCLEAYQNPAIPIPFKGRFHTIERGLVNIEGNITNLLMVPEVKATIFTFRDATEKTKSELAIIETAKQLKHKTKELKLKNKELERFNYITAHDLKEPLRMCINFLQLFESKYKDIVDENGKKYIHYAVEASLRMNALITDLLKYAKLESNQLEHIDIDMNEIIKEVTTLFQHKLLLTKGSIKVINDFPVIKAGRTPMMQIMQNLVGNALKFNSNNVPEVTLSSIETTNEWIFSVQDNGIGIESKYAEKIFEVFQRLNRREDYEGTGIGLAICKKIVDQYQGRIWVESVLGEGACFKFSIPKS